MKHEPELRPASDAPRWSTPSEARNWLDREIDGFVRGATTIGAEPDATLALKVTAGLGKTATTLRAIARHGDALLSRGHVLYYVPTLDLAVRACADFKKLAPELPCRVIRGRHAQRPDNRGMRMCERADIATAIAGFVPSVTQALCRARDSFGTFVLSRCAAQCPYLEQKDVEGPHVVFLSHAYLTVDPPVDRQYPIALRVVDEKVWPTLTRTSYLSIDDFMRVPPQAFPAEMHTKQTCAKAAILDGLQRGLPLRDHLSSSGIDVDLLQALVKAENNSRNELGIGPWDSTQSIQFQVDTFDKKAFVASRQREHIFKRLANEDSPQHSGLGLIERVTEHATQQVIEISGLAAIGRDAPLLLLDADADKEITDRIAPGATFVTIQAPPVADIVQVSDLTLSNSWLLHPEHGLHRRAAVMKILAREVINAAGGGVLAVATKAVLKQLHLDLGHCVAEGDAESLKRPLCGANPRWFGPKSQGVNDFESYAAIVIIGRLQPGLPDIEASARAVFGKDNQPIATHTSGLLPAIRAKVVMADGSRQDAVTHAHPDPRAQTILAQTRECGTLQAIARLRLVSPNRNKRVVILSNLPLPDFPISRLATFTALERDLEHEPDWRGFVRLETALSADSGGPVRGTRLTAGGLAADLPRDFETESCAAGFRRGRTTPDLISLAKRIAKAKGWEVTPLLLRRSSGGKPVPAIIFGHQGVPLAMARTLWPEYTPEFARTDMKNPSV